MPGHRSSLLSSRSRLFITAVSLAFHAPGELRFVIDAFINNRVVRDGEQQVTLGERVRRLDGSRLKSKFCPAIFTRHSLMDRVPGV